MVGVSRVNHFTDQSGVLELMRSPLGLVDFGHHLLLGLLPDC